MWLPVILLLASVVSAHDGVDDGHPYLTSDTALNLPPGVLKIIEYREQLAASITFLIAFIAGIITFTSPCGFVVLPAFFSFLFKERKRAVLMTALFSLGLILGFTALGLTAAIIGTSLNVLRLPFARIAGFVLIAFGIMMFLNKGFTWFQFKLDHHKTKSAFTMLTFGFFFALGWTPCIGPVLGGILLLAASAETILVGTAYLVFFGLGVSVPLLIIALFADKYDLAGKPWIRGKLIEFKLFGKQIVTHTYNIISGIILIGIGITMAIWRGTGILEYTVTRFTPWGMTAFYGLNDALTNSSFFTSGAAQIIGIILGILMVLLLFWILYRQWKKSKEL